MTTAATHKSTKVLEFYTGQKIPAVGLGTWQSIPDEVYDAVLSALKVGHRHIDTAALYNNEEAIGKAIKDSGIPREELFVTTRLWIALNPNGNHPSFPTLPDGNRNILHDWDFVKTYELLQKLLELGKTMAIGVSNFSISNLKKLIDAQTTKIKPVVHQVELHPYLHQHKLLKLAKENGILLESYSPLGSTNSPLLSDEVVVKIANNYGVSPATILISWTLWRGTLVLPKSVSEHRIESNLNVVDLSDEDGKELDNLHLVRGITRFITQDWSPVVVFDSDE